MLASRSSRSFVMKSSADCFSRTRIESVAAFFFSASPATSSPIRSSRATSEVRAASSSRSSARRARDCRKYPSNMPKYRKISVKFA